MKPVFAYVAFNHKLIFIVWLSTNAIKRIFFFVWRHVDISWQQEVVVRMRNDLNTLDVY